MSYIKDGLIEAVDFNNFRSQVANIYGIGFGNSGYGQTAIILPTVLGGSVELVKSVEWIALRSAIEVCSQHQGISVSLPPVTQLSVGSLIKAHPPATGDLASSISSIVSSRLTAAGNATTLFFTQAQSSRGTAWATQIVYELTATFSSFDAARYFFNSGSQIILRASRTGGSSTIQNSAWTTFLSNIGSIVIDHTNTYSTNNIGTGSTLGYYDFSTGYQLIYTATMTETHYTTNNLNIYAKMNDGPGGANGDNGKVVKIKMEFNDTHTSGSDVVDGTITAVVDIRRATAYLTVSAPVLANVTELTAGS